MFLCKEEPGIKFTNTMMIARITHDVSQHYPFKAQSKITYCCTVSNPITHHIFIVHFATFLTRCALSTSGCRQRSLALSPAFSKSDHLSVYNAGQYHFLLPACGIINLQWYSLFHRILSSKK